MGDAGFGGADENRKHPDNTTATVTGSTVLYRAQFNIGVPFPVLVILRQARRLLLHHSIDHRMVVNGSLVNGSIVPELPGARSKTN